MAKVDTPHEQYTEMSSRWKRCRDAVEGRDAVAGAGAEYLPMLSGQSQPEYDAYKARASFYGAVYRTVQGHSGSVFRRPPEISVPDAAEEWLEDITLTGVPLVGLMLEALRELLEVGRYALYVEMPRKTEDETATPRPYLVLVPAESVVSWRTENRDGKQILNRVVVRESVAEQNPEDEFILDTVEQYRVFALAEDGYSQTVWRKPADSNEYEIHEGPIYPDKRAAVFDEIPFWCGNVTDVTPNVQRPPLMEIVDLSLSMWRNSADLENGYHYVGIPTPWVAGFPVKTKLNIGSNRAWISDKTDAKVGMLEFTGQGLNGLSEHIDRKKADCSVFGSRLLEEQKKAAETAETVRLRHAGESASLVSMADTLDATFGAAMKFALNWAGITGESEIRTNRDLLAIKATPQELQALTKALQSGAMSWETYYHNLEQLELSRPGVDAEEEIAAIESDADRAVVLTVSQGRPADEAEEERAAALADEAEAA